MTLKTTRMDVWVAPIDDAPGGLARTLRAISDMGADLDCVLARREGTMKDKGVVFITPLHGKEQLDNADQIGLHRAGHIHTLKVEGEDHPGMGAEITRVVGEAGINLHGLTATVLGRKFVCYASFDSVADLERAEQAIHSLDHERFPRLRAAMRKAMRERTVTT